MRTVEKTKCLVLAIVFTAITSSLSAAPGPANPPANFKHQFATVNGVKIHYVIGGKGDPLLLIHGFGQNWYMWNRLLPELSKRFTVVAPDLRGVGESEKTNGGYDKKNMAVDMHELMKELGFSQINLAGHDIGLMVAYAYAAQFPDDVKKLALLDALLPGIEPVVRLLRTATFRRNRVRESRPFLYRLLANSRLSKRRLQQSRKG
jgi:pimeloyl-ACP methyl ester carboxylesterase